MNNEIPSNLLSLRLACLLAYQLPNSILQWIKQNLEHTSSRPFFIFAPPPSHTHLPLPSIFVPPATKKMLVNMQLSYFIPLLRRKTYTTCTIKSISTAKLNTIDCRLHPNDHYSMCFHVLGESILI